MSDGNNGNGEVRRLVDLKHTFKAEASQLEADLRAKFAQELEAAEKDLKDKYLEQVVDWFYGGGFNGKPPQPERKEAGPEPAPPVEQKEAPLLQGDTPDTVLCTSCGAKLLEGDQFCSQCSAPVETATDQPPVATAGRLQRPGEPRYSAPTRLTADERIRSWGRTQRR